VGGGPEPDFGGKSGAVRPILVVCAVLMLGCRRDARPRPAPAPPLEPVQPAAQPSAAAVSSFDAGSPTADAGARRAPAAGPARADERITVPGGKLFVGSLPGDDGRDPRIEPAAFEATLSPYEIDALPYPNDPAQPPRTDVSRGEAAKLCAARGARLCTEIEWENACKGGRDDRYSTGDGWDPTCTRNLGSCVSGHAARAMGAMREWTSSDVLPLDRADKPRAAVRGSAPAAEPPDHRCAHRIGLSGADHAKDLGFRCCRTPPGGSPNTATIPAPRLGPVARKTQVDLEQLGDVLATVPELSAIKPPMRFFAEPDDTATVVRRGNGADLEGFTLTTSPLIWNPAPGDEVLLALGRTNKDSFIVALYRLPGGRFRIASSLLMRSDTGPFALAYHPEVRERIIWSSCWKCRGEEGTISLRDGKRIIIVQQ
jgi:hypothetical protein